MPIAPPQQSPIGVLRRILVVLVTLVVVATACTGSDDSSTSDTAGGDNSAGDEPIDAGEPQRGGELVVGIVGESNSWYPPEAEWAFSAGVLVVDAIYENLFVQTGSGEILPYLAADFATFNDDATEWTVSLRPGITFHDGTPLDADALVEMSALWDEGRFSTPGEGVAATTKVDDLTVIYTLHEPDPAFETTLAGNRGIAFSPTAARAFGEDSAERPVGTGPFVLQSWVRDSEVVVTRNANYWQDGQPYLDRITFRVLVDGNSRRASLESGDIDIATQGGTDGVQSVVDAGFTPIEYIGNGAGVIVFNTLQPPMDDKRVRRAVAHAADPEDVNAINPGQLSGELEARTQYFAPASRWYDASIDSIYPAFDVAKAEELIAEYVNDPTRSDGAAVGDPIRFRYVCTSAPTNRLISQLLLQAWSDVGLEVEFSEEEQASMVTRIVGGPATDPAFLGDFDASCWADGTNSDPLVIFDSRYGEVESNVLNWTNFTSPAIDEQVEILRTELDFETRRAAAVEISRITADELPIHWIGSGSTIILAADRVKNIDVFTWPDGTPGSRIDRGRVWWTELFVDDAEPITDIPTDLVALPEGAATTTTAPQAPALPEPDEAVLAALPGAGSIPDGFTEATPNYIFEQCPGNEPLAGLSPESVTINTFSGPSDFGPFVGSVVVTFPDETGPEQYLASYAASAVADCAEFETVTAQGAPLTQATSALATASYGEETGSYSLRGASSGFPVNTDLIHMRIGNRLAIAYWLAIGAEPDLAALETLAADLEAAVVGLGQG